MLAPKPQPGRIELTVRRSRIAVFHLAPAEMADFVATDVILLRERYDVYPVYYKGNAHGWPDAVRILQAVAATDANVSWFAHHQAYLAVWSSRLLGKPSVVVVGGFDVSSEERPDATIPDRSVRELRYIFTHASSLLPISHRIASLARRYTDREDIAPVPLGFDAGKFYPEGPKDGSVLTVGYVRRPNLERKGLTPFVMAARQFPTTMFYLVGRPLDDAANLLRSISPSNVTLTGWLSEAELVNRMRRASVYVQASTHEGFGSSLAQAMLCGCVPVVTDRGAIPEVVGDSGVYVEVSNPDDLARGIREAFAHPDLGIRARERIANRFNLERRRRELFQVLGRLLP